MPRTIHRRSLPLRTDDEDRQRRERHLRLTFVNVPSALDCRPEPRSAFDKPASDPTRRPWRCFAEPLRACAVAAAQKGGTIAVETERRIVEAVTALLAYVLEPLSRAHVGQVTYVTVARESAEALHAVTIAHAMPTAENTATAEREVDEAITALSLYRGTLRGEPSAPVRPFPLPRGATPRSIA